MLGSQWGAPHVPIGSRRQPLPWRQRRTKRRTALLVSASGKRAVMASLSYMLRVSLLVGLVAVAGAAAPAAKSLRFRRAEGALQVEAHSKVGAYTLLTRAEVVDINGAVVGGVANVINAGNLDNAIGCQNRVLFGQAIFPTLAEKVGCLGFSLAQGHPFGDGNKRTASMAMELLVKKNRAGKGLLKDPQYIVGAVTEAQPMDQDTFITAVGKLIPPALAGQDP